MDTKKHWETVYETKDPTKVSWYQQIPAVSLELIGDAGIGTSDAVIDIGSGCSTLVDALLEKGFSDLSVLDVSAAALAQAKNRLGSDAERVDWYEADVTQFANGRKYLLWHDRAVFHFLTDPDQRRRYVEVLDTHLAEDGHVIIATFSLNGPEKCSGLDIVQYDEEKIANELGDGFVLYHSAREIHSTPASGQQAFSYFCFKRK